MTLQGGRECCHHSRGVGHIRACSLDTYLTDVAINFTSYCQVDLVPMSDEVHGVSGEVDFDPFSSVDFGQVTRIQGLRLAFDASGNVCQPTFWYHRDRFAEAMIGDFADKSASTLQAM